MILHRHFETLDIQETIPKETPKMAQTLRRTVKDANRIVVYFGSREIYADMITAVNSLLHHTKVDKIYLLTEDDEYPYAMPECVENINIRELIPEYYGPNCPNYGTQWTNIGLARTILTKIFPHFDVVLSLDCDTIVEEDIGDLWEIDLEGYDFAGVKEPALTWVTRVPVYINAGVTLFNLMQLRESGRDDVMIRQLSTRRFQFVCQDAMNVVSAGRVLELPCEYNSNRYTAISPHPKIVHFAGDRAWRNYPIVEKYK